MNLKLSEEQELIQSAARELFQAQCPPAVVKAIRSDPAGYPRGLWVQMAELDWMGVAFPEEYGGSGSGFLDLCVLIEEQGRAVVPGPFLPTVVLGGLPILRFGTESQKSTWLPAIAKGECLLTYTEIASGVTWGAAGVAMVAKWANDHWILEGTKPSVPYAQVADRMLVAARTGGSGGITMFLIDARSPGISSERLETLGLDAEFRVAFDRVRVPEKAVLGGVDEGGTIMRAVDQWGAAAKCAEMVGGAQRVLEKTIAYSKERVQFDRPIGSFQAVHHHCANMALDVDTSRFLAYEAIWRLSEGLDADLEVSAAKAWVSEAYPRVCALGHQVHGAIGFTREHDLHLYFRHARASSIAFGDADHHRELVAARLGL